MQCTNCQFHNMPGSAVCGRCGTSLGLATATIDVHPPRAGRFAKSARRVLPVGRAYRAASRAISLPRRRSTTPLMPQFPVLWRMIVPGWSHLYLRQTWRGRLFLAGYLLTLIPGLLLFGSSAGSILVGLAFSVHSSAALDIMMLDTPQATLRHRMAQSVLVSIALGVLVYLPVYRMIGHYVEAHTVTEHSGPFAANDVIVVSPRARPKVGMVVMYDIPEDSERRYPHGHGQRILYFEGGRIDRIVAGPDDKVQWDGQQLLVNGEPSRWLPLEPWALPAAKTFSISVPGDCFVIFPTTDPYVGTIDRDNLWLSLSIVKAERIHGRVIARTQPLRRWKKF